MNHDGPFVSQVITIDGMHCAECKKSIESKIRSCKGVKSVEVNLAENSALIVFDAEETTLDVLRSEITSLGYSVAGADHEKSGAARGIVYGLLPHTGCIAFIAASVTGATAAMNFLRPLLMNPYFFHLLVVISLGAATFSSILYLRKNGILSLSGMKRKWKYLSIMYSSTAGVNILFFMIVFPLLAHASITGQGIGPNSDIQALSSVRFSVDIPCPGHAPLVSEELSSLPGVVAIQFGFPHYFDVIYDSTRTSTQELLSLEVFKVYEATVMDGLQDEGDTQESDEDIMESWYSN
ncbi:MAG: metal-transporting ATPase [Theionarchaea archaeon]|nr:metal-transporting ATPase [Theionarchaea archaeon]